MALPIWGPNKNYALNMTVRRATEPPAVVTDLSNPGFESGAPGWSFGAGFVLDNTKGFAGTSSARHDGIGTSSISRTAAVAVAPGKVITAYAMYDRGSAAAGVNYGAVRLNWYDAAMVQIGPPVDGDPLTDTVGWHQASVTATAPALAAFVRISGVSVKGDPADVWFDQFTWDYVSQVVPSNLVFKATVSGTSGATEPVWPTVVAGTVVDGTVTWTAELGSGVTWEAVPLTKSGATEPNWPTQSNGFVSDGTVAWEAVSTRVEDPNCPNSKVVGIGKSKVYAEDVDVIRYSATVDPLDWTSRRDAGYMAVGLSQAGATDVKGMGFYRSNLIAFTPSMFQNWQIDEDPELIAFIDGQDAIGSMWHKAIQPVANDLFFLSSLGVRSMGLAAGTNNLMSADVGMPIDELVLEALAAMEPGVEPLGCYSPSAGQYLLMIAKPSDGTTEAFVYTIGQQGGGSWSRYILPLAVDAWAQIGDRLYLRGGDEVVHFGGTLPATDFIGHATKQAPFDAVVEWPFLDAGSPAVTKFIQGLDMVGTGQAILEIGYDQTNRNARTDPYLLPEDTLPDTVIGLSLSAPSFAVRLTYTGGQAWSFLAMNLYLDDRRPTS